MLNFKWYTVKTNNVILLVKRDFEKELKDAEDIVNIITAIVKISQKNLK